MLDDNIPLIREGTFEWSSMVRGACYLLFPHAKYLVLDNEGASGVPCNHVPIMRKGA